MKELAKLAGKDVIELLAFITAVETGDIGCYRVEKDHSGVHIWKGDEHVTISRNWGKDWRSGVRNTAVLKLDGEKHYFINCHHFTGEEWKDLWRSIGVSSLRITKEKLNIMSVSPGFAVAPDINYTFLNSLFPDIPTSVFEAITERDSRTIYDGKKYTVLCENDAIFLGSDRVYYYFGYRHDWRSKGRKVELAWKGDDPRTIYFPDRIEHWELYDDYLSEHYYLSEDYFPPAVYEDYFLNVVGSPFHKKINGPSVTYKGGEEWWCEGALHRIDGPAATKGRKAWYYIHGKNVTAEVMDMFGCLPRTCTDEQKVVMALKWG